MSKLLLPLLFVLVGCRSHPTVTVDANSNALDLLLAKMNARLALMESVAAYKFNAKKPIADPQREEALLKSMEEKAKEKKLLPELVRRFFAAQIKAAKVVQENHFAYWTKDGIVPKSNTDLTELRTQIDRLNEELVDVLQAHLQKPVEAARLRRDADKRLSGEGIDERVRSLAIEPLLN